MAEHTRVRVIRSIDGADPVDGYVVAVGEDWFLLLTTLGRLKFDGWDALRIKDLASVKKLPRRGEVDVHERVMSAAGEWPPRAPVGCDVSSTEAVVRMAMELDPLVEVHREKKDPYSFLVGAVTTANEDIAWIYEVDVSGKWTRHRSISVKKITRLVMGNSYTHALASVIEPIPTD